MTGAEQERPTARAIDDAIDKWHSARSEEWQARRTPPSLHEWLGWTWEEYQAWVGNPLAVPPRPLANTGPEQERPSVGRDTLDPRYAQGGQEQERWYTDEERDAVLDVLNDPRLSDVDAKAEALLHALRFPVLIREQDAHERGYWRGRNWSWGRG